MAPGDIIAEIVPPDTAYRAVVNISADRIGEIRPRLSVSLKAVYRVTIDLGDDAAFGAGRIEMRPGITVMADILTGERSILSYLLSPVRRVQDQALTEA